MYTIDVVDFRQVHGVMREEIMRERMAWKE
jgi:hypothetical protein